MQCLYVCITERVDNMINRRKSGKSQIFGGVPNLLNYLERFYGAHHPHGGIPNSPG